MVVEADFHAFDFHKFTAKVKLLVGFVAWLSQVHKFLQTCKPARSLFASGGAACSSFAGRLWKSRH